MDSWAMRTYRLTFACVLALLIACSEVSPPLAIPLGPELVHSIKEYDIEYQSRAEAVTNELMQHWPKESYVRWRPVRIDPSEFLNGDSLVFGAMPTSLRLSPFPDVELNVHLTKFNAVDHMDAAAWTGEVVNSRSSYVRISLIGMRVGPAFLIKIWNPPNKYQLFATDSLDVYVAVEIRVDPLATKIDSGLHAW
jgi:hypothetical protein